MKIALAVFAKTIGLSAVKTRLAADIGTEDAEAFYKRSKGCIEETVRISGKKLPGILEPIWALAEEAGPRHSHPSSFPAIWTGEGGLGARLANVSEYLFRSHDAVIMMGTDSPQLEASRIVDAARQLQENPEFPVAGPAKDGGFYLFGSAIPVPRLIWESVEYSRDTTLGELVALLSAENRQVMMLAKEQDVDTVEDLQLLIANLSHRRAALSQSQTDLLNWLLTRKPV